MKKIFIFAIVIMLFACKKESTTPDCVNLKITEFSKTCGKDSKVDLYTMDKKDVYVFFETSGADLQYPVFDTNCNIICTIGGFTGGSTCAEYPTFVKTIWTK